jgi:hypothetical protein
MIPLMNGNGEIDLLVDDPKYTPVDGLEQWQIDVLLNPSDDSSSASTALHNIDNIVTEWINSLTAEQWAKIKRQQSLFGIPLPANWIKVWRFILKEPNLRDAERSTRGGRNIGTYSHLWNMWSEECLNKYTNELDKELIAMVDAGYLYGEIGDVLLYKYGDRFWKKRKANSKTTTSQVVNNYLYWKIPNKIARADLLSLCLKRLKLLKKPKEKENERDNKGNRNRNKNKNERFIYSSIS